MKNNAKNSKSEGLVKNLESWCLIGSGIKSLKPVQLRPNRDALDILYDELLARRKKNGHAKFNYIYIWKTKSGETIRIKDMETKHLYNIIHYIEENSTKKWEKSK